MLREKLKKPLNTVTGSLIGLLMILYSMIWGGDFTDYHQAKSLSLEKLSFSGTSYWSIEPLLASLGTYTRSIAPFNQKWLYRSSIHELVFMPGSMSFRINGMSIQTIKPVQAHQGRIYVSETDADGLFTRLIREWNLVWISPSETPLSTPSDRTTPPKILDVRLEKKVNGYLIIITGNRPLWEKLDYDYSLSEVYWINLNILNGTTGLTESQLSAKLPKPIRQVKLYRFGKSIQFSFRMSFPVEKVELKNDSLNNQLWIILRQAPDSQVIIPVIDEAEDDSLGMNEDSPAMLKNHGSIRRIVIDPGHGGRDPGSIGRTRHGLEKDLTLDIALRLRDILKKNSRYEIIMTRDKDLYVSLDERRRIANHHAGDLFISIHCNSVSNPKRRNVARGFETYFLSLEKNDEARETARLENSVIDHETDQSDGAMSADTVKNIVFDLLHNSYLRESSRLADILQQEMGRHLPTVARKVDQASFIILKGLYMPGVLVEVGFISNAEEEKQLMKESYRQKIAEGLNAGLIRFIDQYAGLTD